MPTLQWLTRNDDIKTAGKAAYRLLREEPELGAGDKDCRNMIIQGDNLEALKALLPFYAGQVKCIYIDPPYNTGYRKNADGTSVGYDDNLEHTIWLSMMYPRLELLRELLSEDGLIAVQIDDREFARLFLILAEIFGEKNLKIVCVKMSEATGVKMASVNKAGSIPKIKEFIILAKKVGLKGLSLERIAKEQWDDEYKICLENVTSNDIFRLKEIIEDEERTSKDVLEADKICSMFVFSNVNSVMKHENVKTDQKHSWLIENAWRIVRTVATVGSAKTRADDKRHVIGDTIPSFIIETTQKKSYIIKNGYDMSSAQPRIKLLFADDYLTEHPGDLWVDIKTTGLDNEGGVTFTNGKKPEKLLYRIIKMNTNPGDLVLDSFLGSGTTAAVAHKMGRKYIGIEMGEHAKTHCAARLKKVIDGEQGGISEAVGWKGGGGFRFYTLGETVFDERGQIRGNIKFAELAAHIWFYETKTPYNKPKAKSVFLGAHNNTAYALLYNGILGDRSIGGGNVLTGKTLDVVIKAVGKASYEKFVIYGAASRLGGARLKRENITFKQIPFDVRA